MFRALLKRLARLSHMPRHLDPPTGTFDILGARCVGWVETQDGAPGETYRLVFRRGADILAESQTEPADTLGHAHFALDLTQSFTGEDLLREAVHLLAYDTAGNEGRLTLNGATQVELIQRHMSQPQEVIVDLDLSVGGNAEGSLGEGWSPPEVGWRWNFGTDSEVRIDHPSKGGEYEMTVLSQPFLCLPAVPEQRVEYYLDGELIHAVTKDPTTSELTRFKIPGALFDTHGPKTLRLHHPDATRPCDVMETAEARQLAFAYKKIVLARLKPAA